MNTKKFVLGTLVGGISMFLLGFIFYGLLLMDFFASQNDVSMMKNPPEMWALGLGNLASGAFFTYIFLKWANISTFNGGLKAGATIGFLMSLSFDLIMYGTSTAFSLMALPVDVITMTVMSAISGGMIGWILGRK